MSTEKSDTGQAADAAAGGAVTASTARRLRVAVLLAGLVGAIALPVTGVGIGWVVATSAVLGVLAAARSRSKSSSAVDAPGDGPSEEPGDAPGDGLAEGPGERAWRAAAGVAALMLVAVSGIRAAGWLVGLCLATSLPLASYALTGGRSAVDLARGGVALIPATVRGMGWAADGTRPGPEGQRRVGRVAAGLTIGTFLLLVFGALFRAADPAFAALTSSWRDEVSVWMLVRGLLGFAAVSAGALGVVQLVRQRPAPANAREVAASTAHPRPGLAMGLGLAEWVIPLAMLDALFGVFVWVQITVLFADDGYVLAPGGPDYAEYARGGSIQLGVVALLTLGVIGAVGQWVRPHCQTHRGLLRILGGLLCGLTLVVVASGLTRLALYAGAYGFTRPRLLVYAGEVWLGIVFVLFLVAGVRLRAPWFPRAVLASAVAVLIALAAANPEARMARSHIDRLTHNYPVDLYFLSHLSADAVDAIDRLPEPQRSCALANLAQDLAVPEPWYRWNAARAHARDVLATRPYDKTCFLSSHG
jgi:Domain of unknown function (DUF4173)